MSKIAAAVGLAATLLSTVAVPSFANAQTYDRQTYRERQVERREGRARRSYYRGSCRHEQRSSGNKGTVAGALVGGASGALIGGDVLGGLVGAGVGAVAGHEIAKRRVRC